MRRALPAAAETNLLSNSAEGSLILAKRMPLPLVGKQDALQTRVPFEMDAENFRTRCGDLVLQTDVTGDAFAASTDSFGIGGDGGCKERSSAVGSDLCGDGA